MSNYIIFTKMYSIVTSHETEENYYNLERDRHKRFPRANHFEFEMDHKWFISNIFGVFCFLYFSNFFLVTSHSLPSSGRTFDDIESNGWEIDRDQFPVLRQNFLNNLKEANGNLTKQSSGKDDNESKRWSNVLLFDKHCNLTEAEKGPQNETKNIFISTEEHLRIFENEDDEDELELNDQMQERDGKNIFHLLNPEDFFSQIIAQDQTKALERKKRQAEDEKRRCRCRRKRRRGMTRRERRRRRRNRTGQQRQARRRRRRGGRRRNGRRGGRRRCVCRKKGDGDGKSEDGEEPEVEEVDGEEEETTEGGDETTTEEDGEEGDEGEEEGEEDGEEESEEETDEEEDDEEDEEGDDEESSSAPEREMPPLNNMPTYLLPYPNMVEMPIAVMPLERIPIKSYSRSTAPTYQMPSYLAVGAPLSENTNSDTEQ